VLKFLCKFVNLTRSYKRKQKGIFFSEHSVVVVVVVVVVVWWDGKSVLVLVVESCSLFYNLSAMSLSVVCAVRRHSVTTYFLILVDECVHSRSFCRIFFSEQNDSDVIG